jgi:type 1 glutamine amidotransferase
MPRWIAFCSFLAAAAFLLASREGGAVEEKIKVLIVSGHDVGAHDWRKTTPLTRAILEEDPRFEVRVSEDREIFASSKLGQYDVLVLNYGHNSTPELSPEAKEGLLSYVKSGKGLVALHYSLSAFQSWEAYRQLLGRMWKDRVSGHGPRGKFKVKIEDKEHPVTAGLDDFEADDELYAKLQGDEEIHVLASAYSDWSQKVEPIVFARSYGAGRVLHNVLGHDVRARESEAYKVLLRRGVEWSARGKCAPAPAKS